MPQGYGRASRIGPSEGAVPDMAIRRAERIGPTPREDVVAMDLGYKNAAQLVNNFNIEGVTNLFPKHIQRLFSEELAQKVWTELSNLGLDKIANVASDMIGSPRHMAISSTLREFGLTNKPDRLAEYELARLDRMKKVLAREPLTRVEDIIHADPNYNHNVKNFSDEDLAKYSTLWGGRVGVSKELENEPISETYKAIRHEFSHAADDLHGRSIGPSFGKRGNDPKYWVNLAEIRARSAEPNYVRDMTGKAEPRTIIDVRRLPGDHESKFLDELPHRRSTHTEKVIDEINRGKNIAEDKLAEQYRLFPNTPPGYLEKNDFEPELGNTVSHYFGPTHEYQISKELLNAPPIVTPGRLTLPADKKYDWQRLIQNDVRHSAAPGTLSPTDKAIEDLTRRLRGSK